MKKLFFVLVVIFVLCSVNGFAAENQTTLTFAWGQDTTNLDHWTLYQSNVAGGPYTKVLDIPWNGQSSSAYTASNNFVITGNPGETITKYFVVTASSVTEESGNSNEISYAFLIPAPISTPFSLTITVETP